MAAHAKKNTHANEHDEEKTKAKNRLNTIRCGEPEIYMISAFAHQNDEKDRRRFVEKQQTGEKDAFFLHLPVIYFMASPILGKYLFPFQF